MKLQIGDKAVTATLQSDAESVSLGRLSIPTAGVHELSLRPVQAGWLPVILRSIALRPAAPFPESGTIK